MGAAAGVLALYLIGRSANNATKLMEGKGIRGRGELRFNFQFQTQPLVHILCTSYVLIAFWRGVWLQRGFVVWTQTKERERGEERDQKLSIPSI
jgi:hypothetical protein